MPIPSPRSRRGARSLPALALVLAACVPGRPGADESPTIPPPPPIAAELDALHPEVRAAGLEDRTFSPEEYWDAVLPILEGAEGFRIEEIGASAEGRPLRHVAWGEGPTAVLLWSQMHGDESTASMALADIFRFLGTHSDHALAGLLRERTTLHFLPVMNPDGAARFQRRNAQGIDLNRDARALATPEGQALKELRDRLEPAFGFNLHDQAVGTRVGRSDRGTAIALLAPPFDEDRGVNPVRQRAKEVAAVIRTALEPHVADHIARWDDTFNPRAFGDLMTAWGVSTILIESGGWEGDPQKQFLRKLNFIAILTALEAIADGSHEGIPVALYSSLPENGRRVGDLLLLGATVAVPGLPEVRADVLVNFDHPLAELGGRVAEVGDLAETQARDTVMVDGLYLVALEESVQRDRELGGVQIALGTPAHFLLARDPEGADVVWELRGDIDPESPRPAVNAGPPESS